MISDLIRIPFSSTIICFFIVSYLSLSTTTWALWCQGYLYFLHFFISIHRMILGTQYKLSVYLMKEWTTLMGKKILSEWVCLCVCVWMKLLSILSDLLAMCTSSFKKNPFNVLCSCSNELVVSFFIRRELLIYKKIYQPFVKYVAIGFSPLTFCLMSFAILKFKCNQMCQCFSLWLWSVLFFLRSITPPTEAYTPRNYIKILLSFLHFCI